MWHGGFTSDLRRLDVVLSSVWHTAWVSQRGHRLCYHFYDRYNMYYSFFLKFLLCLEENTYQPVLCRGID